ncbi:hypothetical protein CBM2617_A150029 [Cupriavidus taiwanensis]|nr:hypothetical protein CBM2617_A150029 [Cupriavidus taiwanensis]SOZ77005.1 hypothetical protein CBM2622_A140066 [Cupriavidus taiwanensis]SOZ77582.1 hypothetical protein CBM2618_A150066 [Cupriavidus taiwanensis]SOZ83165.1 hypothetical protein CBM2621_A140066 [Cupriavidus taiwanensis]
MHRRAALADGNGNPPQAAGVGRNRVSTQARGCAGAERAGRRAAAVACVHRWWQGWRCRPGLVLVALWLGLLLGAPAPALAVSCTLNLAATSNQQTVYGFTAADYAACDPNQFTIAYDAAGTANFGTSTRSTPTAQGGTLYIYNGQLPNGQNENGFVYMPPAGFVGTDSATFFTSDDGATWAPNGTVNFNVSAGPPTVTAVTPSSGPDQWGHRRDCYRHQLRRRDRGQVRRYGRIVRGQWRDLPDRHGTGPPGRHGRHHRDHRRRYQRHQRRRSVHLCLGPAGGQQRQCHGGVRQRRQRHHAEPHRRRGDQRRRGIVARPRHGDCQRYVDHLYAHLVLRGTGQLHLYGHQRFRHLGSRHRDHHRVQPDAHLCAVIAAAGLGGGRLQPVAGGRQRRQRALHLYAGIGRIAARHDAVERGFAGGYANYGRHLQFHGAGH